MANPEATVITAFDGGSDTDIADVDRHMVSWVDSCAPCLYSLGTCSPRCVCFPGHGAQQLEIVRFPRAHHGITTSQTDLWSGSGAGSGPMPLAV